MLSVFGRNKSAPSHDVKNWYKDRYESALVWRNILVIITLACLVLAMVAVLAVQQLTPSKTVEPFLIQVEEKSGITQVVDPKKAKELTGNEAVNNYFIIQFLKAREGYDNNYQTYNNSAVRLMATPEIYREFRSYMSPDNTQSPLVRLAYVGTRTIDIRSITYLDKDAAQIRFTINERISLQGEPTQINRIALLKFDYGVQVVSQKDRFINPLGFRIVSYRVDEDVVR